MLLSSERNAEWEVWRAMQNNLRVLPVQLSQQWRTSSPWEQCFDYSCGLLSIAPAYDGYRLPADIPNNGGFPSRPTFLHHAAHVFVAESATATCGRPRNLPT